MEPDMARPPPHLQPPALRTWKKSISGNEHPIIITASFGPVDQPAAGSGRHSAKSLAYQVRRT
jgi:hypothetical protein